MTAFGEEVRAGNPACPDAIACLNQHFREEQSSARLFAPPVLFWARPRRENQKTSVFAGFKFSRIWWMLVVYCKKP